MWTVSGTVQLGSEPISGADVGVAGPEHIDWVTTDEHGRYTIKGHIPGTYILSSVKEGLGIASDRTISVAAGSELAKADMQINANAAISGTVTDAVGNPFSQGTVLAILATTQNEQWRLVYKGFAPLNAAGDFRLEGLPPGRYYLQATRTLADGGPKIAKPQGKDREQNSEDSSLFMAFYPNSDLIDGATPVLIEPGEHREGLHITLNKVRTHCAKAVVAGSPGGARQFQASVTFAQAIGDLFPTIATSKVAVGEQFEICGLARGAYRVFVATWNEVSTGKDGTKPIGFERTDFLVADEDVDLHTLYDRSGIPLRGELRIGDRRPEKPISANGLEINLYLQGRPAYAGETRRTVTQPGGDFLLKSVFVDNYRLGVSGAPRGYYIREVIQNGRDITHESVNPASGDLTIVFDTDGVIIDGQTVGSDNRPVSGATVILIGPDGRTVTSQSDQYGHFSFEADLPPGKYKLLALSGLSNGQGQDPTIIARNTGDALDLDLAPKAAVSKTLIVHAVAPVR